MCWIHPSAPPRSACDRGGGGREGGSGGGREAGPTAHPRPADLPSRSSRRGPCSPGSRARLRGSGGGGTAAGGGGPRRRGAARTLPNRSSPGGGLLAAGPVPRLDHPVPHLLPGPHAAPATVRPRRLEGRALGRRELQRPLTRGEAPRAREGGEPVPPYRASPSSLHLPRCPASRQPPRRRRSSASTLWRSMCQRVPPS